MKVHELRTLLADQDDHALVLVRGYEGGVDEIEDLTTVTVALNVNDAWYYGKHEIADEYEEYQGHLKMPAVWLHA